MEPEALVASQVVGVSIRSFTQIRYIQQESFAHTDACSGVSAH